MKNTLRHETGLVLTNINIMPYHDNKKIHTVDGNANFLITQKITNYVIWCIG